MLPRILLLFLLGVMAVGLLPSQTMAAAPPVSFLDDVTRQLPNANDKANVDDPAGPDPAVTGITGDLTRDDEWYRGPWLKPLIDIAFESRKVARRIGAITQGEIVALAAVMFGIWLLFQAAQLLAAFGPTAQPSKVFNTVFLRVLLAMIIVFMLRSPNFFWDIHETVAASGADAGQAILRASTTAFASDLLDNTCQANAPEFVTTIDDAANQVEARSTEQMECTIDMAAKVLHIGLEVAINTFTGKNNAGTGISTRNVWGMLKEQARDPAARPIALVASGFLLFFFGSILIAIPFRIIDVIFKWSIISILAPMLMVAFLFPLTRSIAMAGLKVLFHSALSIVILAVMIGIIYSLMLFMLTNANGGTGYAVQEIYDSKEILEGGLGSQLLFYLVTIGLLGKTMVDSVPRITQSMLSLPMMMKIPEVGTAMISNFQGLMRSTGEAGASSVTTKTLGTISKQNKKMAAALKA